MSEGGEIVVRKRLRAVWLERDVFNCSKCGTKDTELGWNEKDSRHLKEEPEKVLFCKKCLHKFTEKKELEELVNFAERIQIGFYIRLFEKNFIPCDACQD